MDTKKLTKISVLGVAAAIIMLFDFPLWFAPGFYKMDFSEIVVLTGGFAMGPLAAVLIEFIKILLNFLFNSTITMGIGELANFIMGCAFTVPAVLIYKKNRTLKGAIGGMLAGTVTLLFASSIINAFVLLPVYSAAFGMGSIMPLISAGTKINPMINNLFTFILFAVVPFNLLKCVAVILITLPLYKRVSWLLRGDSPA